MGISDADGRWSLAGLWPVCRTGKWESRETGFWPSICSHVKRAEEMGLRVCQ